MSGNSGRQWLVGGAVVLALIGLATAGARYALYRLAEGPSTDIPEESRTAPTSPDDIATEEEAALFSSKDFSLRAFLEPKAAKDPVDALKAIHRWEVHRLKEIEAIPDYSMTLVKHEEVKGKLWPQEKIKAKIRHQPFSVYSRHEEPSSLKGQEAIYVEGRNNGKLIGHTVGLLGFVGGKQILDLHSALAMKGNRHPITHIGIRHMMREEVVDLPNELAWNNFTVEFLFGADVDGRKATGYRIRHKQPTPECDYCYDEMYFDDEYLVPVRYVRYGWPKKPGAEPHLVEEYNHLDLKFNRGFTDKDFDPANPEYKF